MPEPSTAVRPGDEFERRPINARSNSSRVLAFAARINVLSYDHINSIGEQSGE